MLVKVIRELAIDQVGCMSETLFRVAEKRGVGVIQLPKIAASWQERQHALAKKGQSKQ